MYYNFIGNIFQEVNLGLLSFSAGDKPGCKRHIPPEAPNFGKTDIRKVEEVMEHIIFVKLQNE